jgi:putative ABC transport system permease protein
MASAGTQPPAGPGAGLQLREGVSQAVQVIVGHPLRSFLLILGVAIGVATLLAIITIVSGLSGRIRDDIVSANRPYVVIARYVGLGGEDIDAKLRRAQLEPDLIPYVAAADGVAMVDYNVSNSSGTVLRYGEERSHFVQVVGTAETFIYMYSFTLGEGRFFTREEIAARADVCVLGYGPRQDLFPRRDPIGKRLRIYGKSYRIVGAMEKRGSIIGQLGDNYAVVPWTSFERDFVHEGMEDRTLSVSVTPGRDTDEVISNLTGQLRKGRRLRPGEPNDFDVVASQTYGDVIDSVTGGIALVLVVLSSIGLMVGGIGVMNIMLISVTERTREIGLRMALGARRQALLFQVLVEAATLTGIGGIIGIGLGYLLSWAATGLLRFPFGFSPTMTLGAVLFSVAIGVFFGLYPANRAARLDPIEALQRD